MSEETAKLVIAGGGASRIYEGYEGDPRSENHPLWLAGLTWQ